MAYEALPISIVNTWNMDTTFVPFIDIIHINHLRIS